MLFGPCPLTSGCAPLMGQESRGREKSEQGAYFPTFSRPHAGYAPLLPDTAFEKVAPSVQLSQVLAGSASSLALSSRGGDSTPIFYID